MVKPIHCNTLNEVRNEIDRIDSRIVELLVERISYVLQAARFKDSKRAVRVPDRIEAIVKKVRGQAEELDSDPAYIESLFRYLIEQSIAKESLHWATLNKQKETRE
ncbi:MAG: hypothetical protein CL398_11780 [Acidiferrobacteraceae bacterium]|nr:hypothetical protein [Acidiferrobacteraceae bacterium]|tara:strand:- start:551 stop:868 length:318 start_codon:yes stop_codon:yes gene_type:complete